MADINKIFISGRITKDSEIRFTPSQMAILKFTVANGQGYGDNKKTFFFDCTMFGKYAEAMEKILKKGTPVTIEGRLQIEEWEKDGQKFRKPSILVDNVSAINPTNISLNVVEKDDPIPTGFSQIAEDIPF